MSRAAQALDEELSAWRSRPLEKTYRYLDMKPLHEQPKQQTAVLMAERVEASV